MTVGEGRKNKRLGVLLDQLSSQRDLRLIKFRLRNILEVIGRRPHFGRVPHGEERKARSDGLESDQLFLAAQDDPADADELGSLERLSDYAEALARRRPVGSDVLRRVQQDRVQFRRTDE